MSNKTIILTTGDADGIGTEVTAKALHRVGPHRGYQFVLWRSPKTPRSHLSIIDRRFDRLTAEYLPDGELPQLKPIQILDICSPLPPAVWVEQSAQACVEKRAHALVTGPLSKTAIHQAGLKELGHTGILARVSGAKSVRMFFWGQQFSVILHTDHIPLKDVPLELHLERLQETIRLAQVGRKLLTKTHRKPLALLGLNPHAGENGLLGAEEKQNLKMVLQKMSAKDIVGPLVPDAAFLPENWKKYSVYISLYHDQGLIPFKLVHGHRSGVHLTLGLPFIRTSVDHGCAKDIFGKNLAKPNSMIEAIRTAIQLVRKGRKLC